MNNICGNFILVLLFVACCTRSEAQRQIAITECDSGGRITAVRASPCTEEPCTFRKGTDAKVEVDFHTNQISQKLTLQISAEIFGLDHPFPGMENGDDACQEKGITCPIEYNTHQVMSILLRVPASSPSLKTTARFNVTGDKSNVFCFEAEVLIK